MKHCKICNLNYDSNINKCLFCDNELEVVDNINNNYYPYYKKKNNNLFYKIFIIINLISLVITLFIDILHNKYLSWSLIVLSSNIYLILLFYFLLYKNKLSKVISFLILTTLLVISIGFIIKDYYWALDFVLPFSLIISNFILFILVLISKSKDHLSSLLIITFFGLLSLLLVIFKISKISWAIYSCFFYSIFILLSLFVFIPKDLKEEFKRKFHL